MREIRPNLWLYEATASGITVRGAVVIGERYAAVWDSLAQPADVAILSDLLGDTPFYLVYSHADWDHCWGTSGLTRAPMRIIAHAECRRRFDDDVPATLARMQNADPEQWGDVRLVPPNLSFSASLRLDLGGITLELRHLPGHTRDCIVGWLPEWGALLGGDAIETPLPVVNSGENIGAWLKHLEAWAAREDLQHAIPSHGSCDGREALDRTIGYLRALTGSGDFDLPAELDDFYARTHKSNLQIAAKLQSADG